MNNSIQEKPYITSNLGIRKLPGKKCVARTDISNDNSLAFKGSGDFSKHFWLNLKRLSGTMKEITEVTNALIAAFGTGVIAPLIILGSPGKGDKEDKDKKFFQAIRQPLSAGLALGFQLPATYGVNKLINSLAYNNDSWIMKHANVNKAIHNFFDDEVLGTLVPNKKYLRSKITADEIRAAEQEFDGADGKLKTKLQDKIKNEYKESGLEISEEKLAKVIKKDKKGFLLDTIADRKYEKCVAEKYEELKSKVIDIKNKNLVTEDLKYLSEFMHEEELKTIEKEANLNLFDKTIKLMGFENKKLKALKDKQDNFKIEKSIELLKEKSSELMTDKNARLKNFVEARLEKAQKGFSQQKFWLSLFVNLFMVTASCYALNWAHPRLKEVLDRNKKPKDAEDNLNKKVEVKA